jgi:hypothetical protein
MKKGFQAIFKGLNMDKCFWILLILMIENQVEGSLSKNILNLNLN